MIGESLTIGEMVCSNLHSVYTPMPTISKILCNQLRREYNT